jgi:hypothetical protein
MQNFLSVTQVTDENVDQAFNHLSQFLRSMKSMKSNIGGIDRILRILVGLALIGLAATDSVGIWGYLGILPFLTGVIGWCPPYALFGWNTCSIKDKT